MTNHVTRRTFMTTAGKATIAATLATSATSMTAKSYARVLGANDRIGVGIIGAGVIGTAHLNVIKNLKEKNNLLPVAVADCWKTRADKGKELVGAEHSLMDYRKLLDMKEVDYAVVAVPEHWHWTMTIDAMDAGKAVYCEKPLTHTIPEAQAVMKKQKETNRPLQVGVQAMSDDSYITARDAIRRGVIGKVVQAQIEYVRRYDAKAGPWRVPTEVAANQTKPADLDWKAWLGSAESREWDPHHYFEWRCYSAYSGGICTDLFIHRITRIMRACDLLYPRRVAGMGGIWQWPDGRDLPDNIEMICEYPRGMTVYVLGTMSNRVGVDHLIRGYRGTLFFTSTGWVAKDKDGKVLEEHTKTGGEDQNLHHTNLHNHLRNGEALNCPIELGMAGVVAVNMANESWRSSQMMGWDKQNQKMVPANTLKQSHEPEES
ncbi:Gfo/Idh/MocA family protein [Schlesneria paludicola]|uniref:Gfo/Idh/MocA family protein n=1 Tax=Schlesneria paludicola TaxID=360056 RepID=UPI00058E7ADC|nr:Gfo/Idh/MocA family oxidoreductase [Schlesneria paludicola]